MSKIKSADNSEISKESVIPLNFLMNYKNSTYTLQYHCRCGHGSFALIFPPPLPFLHLEMVFKAIFGLFPTATETFKL